VPLAAYCTRESNGQLRLRARLGMPDSSVLHAVDIKGSDPEALGLQAAQDLRGMGADSILATLNQAS
jgi:hydroxymethylbilane synthase